MHLVIRTLMESNVMERTIADVLNEALRAEGESLFVVAPDAETIEALVEVLDDSTPSIRLLGDHDTIKRVMNDFLTAGRAADHVEAGRLEIRTGDDGTNTLLVTDSSIVSIVRAEDRVAGLTTDDSAFLESANERFESAWERAAEYSLRTPSLARVRETLAAELGASTADDFDRVLTSLEKTEESASEFDEVTVALLVAAKNEDLLYEISKWGEDVGIASKATFSRTKTELEDLGLIDTEKVPIDVGRPRLRLKFADERLREADADDLIEIARSIIDA